MRSAAGTQDIRNARSMQYIPPHGKAQQQTKPAPICRSRRTRVSAMEQGKPRQHIIPASTMMHVPTCFHDEVIRARQAWQDEIIRKTGGI